MIWWKLRCDVNVCNPLWASAPTPALQFYPLELKPMWITQGHTMVSQQPVQWLFPRYLYFSNFDFFKLHNYSFKWNLTWSSQCVERASFSIGYITILNVWPPRGLKKSLREEDFRWRSFFLFFKKKNELCSLEPHYYDGFRALVHWMSSAECSLGDPF